VAGLDRRNLAGPDDRRRRQSGFAIAHAKRQVARQDLFSALVIMTTHKRSSLSLIAPVETTSAGRRWRVERSA
jgi:hypothetical protein